MAFPRRSARRPDAVILLDRVSQWHAVESGPAGAFTVSVVSAGSGGSEQVAAVARNLSTGETCRGAVVLQ